MLSLKLLNTVHTTTYLVAIKPPWILFQSTLPRKEVGHFTFIQKIRKVYTVTASPISLGSPFFLLFSLQGQAGSRRDASSQVGIVHTFMLKAKLYIPSTIKTEKELLRIFIQKICKVKKNNPSFNHNLSFYCTPNHIYCA